MTIKSLKRLKDDKDSGIGIELVLNDGSTKQLSNEILRRACPCASCLELKGHSVHSKPLGGRTRLTVITATKEESLGISEIWPIGNYAIGMKWSDGHDSGIYTYQNLLELVKQDAS